MSKYSVNGTEVISDSGTINWNSLKNNPSAATVTDVQLGTVTNCGTYLQIQVTRTDSSGNLTFAITGMQSGASNCNCNCAGNCNCNC